MTQKTKTSNQIHEPTQNNQKHDPVDKATKPIT